MKTQILSHKQRILYIDAMRGFTMILVVMGHVMIDSFNLERTSAICQFFTSFRMPLFFFISGYIAYKTSELWTPSFYLKRIKKKAFVQIVPALLFFTLHFFYVGHRSFKELTQYITNVGFGGYWFTFVLFEMFIIFFTISFISKYTHNKVTDILLILVCFFLLYFVHSDLNPQLGFLNLDNLFNYFKFFTFGVLCKKYYSVFYKIINNDIIRAIIISSFFISYFLVINNIFFNQSYNLHMLFKNYIIRGAGLLTVFIFFYRKSSFFEGKNSISQTLQFIGKRTLDIYLLHYFLIPHISFNISYTDMGAIQFTLSLIISLIIIMICILLSEIIRSSSILAHYCFGIDIKTRNK